MATSTHPTFLLPSFPLYRHPSPPVRPPTASSLSLTNPKPSNLPFSSSLSPPKFLTSSPNPQPFQPHHYSSDGCNDVLALSDHSRRFLRLSVRHGDTELAKAVHASIAKLDEDTHLANALIIAYLKLGRFSDAHQVFSALSSPNVVSYTAIISAYAKSGRENEAVGVFFEMGCSDIGPNEFSFVAILTACIRIPDLQLGSQIHCWVIKNGYWSFVHVANALMGVYVRCGCFDYAIQLFGEMPERDLASWNTVVSGVVKELHYERAFELFRDMQRVDGFRVDQFTLSGLLAASTGGFARMEGREIHAHALRIGFESNVCVNNALIGFYSKCGCVKDVVNLFERMPVQDVITWTGMVTGYMEFGFVDLAVEIFDKMPERNCVSYNALLAGFCQNGEGSRALELFQRMVVEGKELTDFTLTSVINACGLLAEVKISEQIHGFIIKFGFGSNSWIEAALLDMCTKCGRMSDAQKLFHQSYDQNSAIIWTSMICGYAQNGQYEEATSLFCMMQAGDVTVDEVASTAVLGVCGTLGFHEMGKQIHGYVLKSGLLSDLGVGNAVFSMYSKCGNMVDAINFFNIMPKRDIVSWNGLIAGHILHRQGDEALVIWSKMEKTGIKPDTITFHLILSACRHTNLDSVDTCRSLFLSIRSLFGIEPTSEHYASMVGVLGYWGYFEEAEEMINKMPFDPNASVWRALLHSCRMRSNTSLGRRAAKHLLTIDPQDPSTYILVSNLYSASGRWHCSERVREEMRKKGLQKHPARSWIVRQNNVHSFYARDKSHSQVKDIYSGLEILILECIKAGYVPDTSFVLHEVEEHQKKDFLFYHSAKLAVTYGLLMTRPGKPVCVVKNILLCGDCHTFLKYVSAVTGREISLRDGSGFHFFRNGECSCRDYW